MRHEAQATLPAFVPHMLLIKQLLDKILLSLVGVRNIQTWQSVA